MGFQQSGKGFGRRLMGEEQRRRGGAKRGIERGDGVKRRDKGDDQGKGGGAGP